jgi:predicted DNA-binding ribbon-helix-helix protein
MNQKSQQIAVGVDSIPRTPPLFSIELESHVFKRLQNLAAKEQISVSELASALIKCLLLLHRTEVKRVIEEIRRNHKCHVSK